VLVNRTKKKAIGEALDLSNTIPENSNISILGTDDFTETKNSDIVIITASTGIYTASRTETLSEQVKMIREILKKIKEHTPNSIVLMVTNPLDIMTYVFQKEGNFPSEKVIGIASSLDSSRFKLLLAKNLGAKPSEISGTLVMGEHGDSMVPIFSRAKMNQIPVLEILNENQIKEISQGVRDYWRTLREFKSRSVYGIAKKVYEVTESLTHQQELSIPASVLLTGQYGISDLCMGVPTRIGKDGIKEIQEIDISESELNLLRKSAEVIKNYIQTC
jgi:malate dehydrogenase